MFRRNRLCFFDLFLLLDMHRELCRLDLDAIKVGVSAGKLSTEIENGGGVIDPEQNDDQRTRGAVGRTDAGSSSV